MVCTRPVHEHDPRTAEVKSYSCGRCPSCQAAKAAGFGVRAWAEMQITPGPCSFITLTYDQVNVPADGSIDPKHWRTFREALDYNLFTRNKIKGNVRYIHCGEYGERFARPHYHSLIFRNLSRASDIALDNTSFRSPWLESLWKRGDVHIKPAHENSGMYIGQYCVKKSFRDPPIDEQPPPRRHHRTNLITGEEQIVRKTYVSSSHGLGIKWLEKHYYDVYTHDFVRIDNREYRPPQTFDRWLESHHPIMWEEIQFRREHFLEEKGYIQNNPDDNAAREQSALQRLRAKFRDYNKTQTTAATTERPDKAWTITA